VSKKRRAVLEGRSAIRSVSDHREARVGAEDSSFQEFVRRLPCVVCRQPTLGGDPCHRLARRRFGDWVAVESEVIGNLFPACRLHHREQHDHGRDTFEVSHELRLERVCKVIGLAYCSGWSAEALAAAALGRGYASIDAADVQTGGLPW